MVTIKNIKSPELGKYSECKVTEMGNIVEVQYMEKVNKSCPIVRVPKGVDVVDYNSGEVFKSDGTFYYKKSTKELKQFQKNVTRKDSKSSLYRTFAKAREVINSNITDCSKVLWVTLTYAENMTDPDILYVDFKVFFEKFRKYCKDNHLERPEYVSMCEPQGRGAWHIHLLILFSSAAPFIPHQYLSDLWGHGFVFIKKLNNVDNVGAYLTAYLGDMELTGDPLPDQVIKEVDVLNDSGVKVKKKYIKGARLDLYPAGFHMLRYSRGCKKPVVSTLLNVDVERLYSQFEMTYRISSELSDVENNFYNIVDKRYYNKLRKVEVVNEK